MAKKYYKPLPECVTIKESEIEGLGLFSTMEIKAGTRIGRTHFKTDDEAFKEEGGWVRLPLGGFFNHSETPNCKVTVEDDKYIFLDTVEDIEPGQELTAKYIWYNPED